MGLGRLKSNLFTHMDLHKTTNKLVNALLEHFGVKTNQGQIQTHKTHHGPNLGEATTFPPLIYYMPLHEAHIQMAFCPGTPKWESRNSQN
jgi:hypothetical protein